MTEPVLQQVQATADQEAAACLPIRIVLDGRHPKLLDHREHVLQLVAGYADVFAVSMVEGRADGARHHLFRVESGEVILDLPETVDSSGTRIQVIAVGGPGTEALMVPRSEFLSVDPITAWITRLARMIAGPNPSWEMREVPGDGAAEIPPGERRRGPVRNIVWVALEAGDGEAYGARSGCCRRWPALAADVGDVDRGRPVCMRRCRQRRHAGCGCAVARHRSIPSWRHRRYPGSSGARCRPGDATPRSSQRSHDSADVRILRPPLRDRGAAFRPRKDRSRPVGSLARRLPDGRGSRSNAVCRRLPEPPRLGRNLPTLSRSHEPYDCAFARRCCGANGGGRMWARWWPGTARNAIRSRLSAARDIVTP